MPLSIIMLTLNEGHHLPGAIENVKDWAEEIFIVDSFSADKTVNIALEEGVSVVQRPFSNFGDQWNFALEHLPIQTPWTLKMDPDERLTDDLKEEISQRLQEDSECCAYEMTERLWFMGRPLHVLRPALRLWKTGTCRFSNVIVNEHPMIDGPVGRLRGVMEHLDSPDLDHWFEKQNRYTTAEAVMAFKGSPLADKPRLFGSPFQRRMWLKKNFRHLPFRYGLLFLYHFFWLGAWRAGRAGYAWSRLRSDLMRFIDYKRREMEITGRLPEARPYGPGKPDGRVQQAE